MLSEQYAHVAKAWESVCCFPRALHTSSECNHTQDTMLGISWLSAVVGQNSVQLLQAVTCNLTLTHAQCIDAV